MVKHHARPSPQYRYEHYDPFSGSPGDSPVDIPGEPGDSRDSSGLASHDAPGGPSDGHKDGGAG